MARKTRVSYEDLRRKPGARRSISFSIAYVRVCEWAREPEHYSRPKPDILEKAREHAERLGDYHILEKIQECYDHYREIDNTPTPKRPGATAIAEAISDEIAMKMRQNTEPYSLHVPEEMSKLDQELDDFIKEMESMGL